jgi:hypothetical protein
MEPNTILTSTMLQLLAGAEIRKTSILHTVNNLLLLLIYLKHSTTKYIHDSLKHFCLQLVAVHVDNFPINKFIQQL